MSALLSAGWIEGLVALLAGVALGGLVAWRTRRSAAESWDKDDNLADLEERLAHLVAALRDLDEQATRLVPTTYAAQRAEFEARAAAVIRQREQLRGKSAAASKGREVVSDTSPTMQFFAARPQLRGALWGGGTVGVLLGLYMMVTHEQRPTAPQAAPPIAAAQASGSDSDAEMLALSKFLRDNPDDVPATVRLAHLLMRATLLTQAQEVNDRALRLQPQNVEARVHAAVLRAGDGETTAALHDLATLAKESPKFAEVWFFRGMLAMRSGDKTLMLDSFRQFIALSPAGPQRDRISKMLQAAEANP